MRTAALVALGLAATAAPQSSRPAPDAAALGQLMWRNIGPANMGGRMCDLEGVPGRPGLVYAGTASGGVWKTENGGHSWTPIFDEQPIASVGDLALEPGNPDVVYVGTGEANPRNSVSFGNGVYKTTDGGRTWTHLGLSDTRHISRVLIHPQKPERVYVGALGHVFGPNPERGVFRSENGGRSWERVLYVDDRHGVADLDLDPKNPNILYAALWQFERRPWTHQSGGEHGGVWRSLDGGSTWRKLGNGLPRLLGRIAVKVAPSDPRIVYVLAESREGILFKSEDRGESFTTVNKEPNLVNRGFYYTDLRVDPGNEHRLYAISSSLQVSVDGGKSFQTISGSTHSDYHALWIDPTDPDRLWQGHDGGIAVTLDRGRTWKYVNNFPLAQFYQLHADLSLPFYRVGGGLQDNGTWIGPSRTREPAGILNDDWRMVSFGDGFYLTSHPAEPELFVSESQGGGILRTDMRTRESQDISPQPRRNDGGPVGALKYRFHWNAPIVASPHDGRTLYFCGNVVFRSPDFGSIWQVISPDLTTNDPLKQKAAGGPVWEENTTAEYHCTVVSFAESPLRRGLLWAGTDDGNLQCSEDAGQTWRKLRVPGMPAHSTVSHVEPSRFAEGTAYVAFDRHMLDDLRPYVWRTTDCGKSFTDVTGDLPPTAYVWVVREDPRNKDLVYAGTELGLYASWQGGGRWARLHLKNLPTVAVHDLLVHPRDNDLILGTHGRGLWILDDATAVQQLGAVAGGAAAHLFPVRPALRIATKMTRYGIGDEPWKGPNPPAGALLTFWLAEAPAKDAPIKLEILDGSDTVLRELESLPKEKGIHRLAWDLCTKGPLERRPRDASEPERTGPRGGPARGPRVLPGTYRARLTVGATVLEQTVEVGVDPTVAVTPEELRRQFELSQELLALRSSLNQELRALDALKLQLEERRKLARLQSPEPAKDWNEAMGKQIEAVDTALNTAARPEGKVFWATGPRLSERLGSLFGGVDGGNCAPTAAQTDYARELAAEHTTVVAECRRQRAEIVRAANELLRQRKLPDVTEL